MLDRFNDKNYKIGSLRIAVTDTGHGISEDDQKRVFGQFVQFNSSDSTYGEFTREGFFSRLGIPSSNVYAINAELDTVEACALEYEARITPLLNKENGFDILILGN